MEVRYCSNCQRLVNVSAAHYCQDPTVPVNLRGKKAMAASFSSPAIGKKLQRKYAGSAKLINIDICHERAVRKYVMGIEDAHKKATKSTLVFR